MDQQTAEFYRTRAEEWTAAAKWEWNQWLDPFLDLLPPGARILELGCGDGRDAARMIARGFAVDPASLARAPLVPTYESLFDGTLEGVRHRELPVAAVQFHPEAGPGPHEAGRFFDAFARATARALQEQG